MTFEKPPGEIHSMPLGFGAACGPRQLPPGVARAPVAFERLSASFLTDPSSLAAILPERLEIRGEPVVTLQFNQFRDVVWLAGRGYSLLSVLVPVRYRSAAETLDGLYQAVMWENMAEPILSGREQCGHPKLFADLEGPETSAGRVRARASWDGFQFAELTADALVEATPAQQSQLQTAAGAGLLHVKYIPRTGDWDVADADDYSLTPLPGRSNLEDPQPRPRIRVGVGTVAFLRPTWAQMPTQHHIVAALASLPQLEPRGGVVMSGTTHIDCSDQRILA
ncbi:acetoacetate decarboxylase family protein [Phenylobacterium sp.]|uniref:acetoacetate decarboxylase family protein n=1 Tax=Phenylobacterium sp. TaxID=1871053 RepID=UPI0025DD4AC5|nr:acetoacetate decarboxylase family protein [Phenylobacterium sp.]